MKGEGPTPLESLMNPLCLHVSSEYDVVRPFTHLKFVLKGPLGTRIVLEKTKEGVE